MSFSGLIGRRNILRPATSTDRQCKRRSAYQRVLIAATAGCLDSLDIGKRSLPGIAYFGIA